MFLLICKAKACRHVTVLKRNTEHVKHDVDVYKSKEHAIQEMHEAPVTELVSNYSYNLHPTRVIIVLEIILVHCTFSYLWHFFLLFTVLRSLLSLKFRQFLFPSPLLRFLSDSQMLLKKRIIHYNLLNLANSILKSVRVITSCRSIRHLNFVQWIFAIFRQCLNVFPDFIFFDWLELVEAGHDADWDQDDEEEHGHCQECSHVDDEVVTG